MAASKKPEHVNASPLALRELVKKERGASSVHKVVRLLGADAPISNSYWSAWEAGSVPLTDGIRAAVAQAFGWELDWPENPPAAPISSLDALRSEVAELRAEVRETRALQERAFQVVVELAQLVERQSPPPPRPKP